MGDFQFQQKCLGKMKDVSAKEGRTVLFVSHNITAIQALCGKTIYLKSGRLAGMGPTSDLVEKYLTEAQKRDEGERGKKTAELGPGLVLGSLKFNPNPIVSGQAMSFCLEIAPTSKIHLSEIAILIYSSLAPGWRFWI